MFKESINNLVKYSAATEAVLQIKVESGFVCVQVEDNGRGFNVAAVSDGFGGNGLPNMKKRAAGLGGKFEIHSEKEKGTKIQFSVPLR